MSSNRDALPRRPKFRRRSEDRPDEVLNSALILFTERGYANTSVEDIAARAGISKGAVYLYFPSKQAILEGLITRAITPMNSKAFEEAAAHIDDVPTALRKLLTIMGQRLSDPGVVAIPKIVIREAVNAPEIAEMYQRALLRHAVPALAAIIQKGVETGQLRKVDPELTVRSIVGPMVVHILMAEIFGLKPKDGLIIDRLVANHLDILFNGLSPDKRTGNG